MAKGDRFWRILERKEALKKAEARGEVADSKEVRMAIMRRVHAGEITLQQAQDEILSIKRKARSQGLMTRSRAYSGR